MVLRYSSIVLIVLACSQTSLAAFDLFELRKSIYTPRCAHACRGPLSTSKLPCTSQLTGRTSEQCYAADDNFLQTLAQCISERCRADHGLLEDFWGQYVVGWQISDPAPHYSYEAAVQLAGAPRHNISWGQDLTQVSLISDVDYEKSYASLADWADNENLHARYG
jgi:hypothetical protein